MAEYWRPATRMACASGYRHLPRVGPSQVRSLRDCAVSSQRPAFDQLGQAGFVPVADPARSRSRSWMQSKLARPDCSGNLRSREFGKATWLPDHRTLASWKTRNSRCLARRLRTIPTRRGAGCRLSIAAKNNRMTSVAVSPDGRWLAVGGWKVLGVRVWICAGAGSNAFSTPKNIVGDSVLQRWLQLHGRWLVSSTRSKGKEYLLLLASRHVGGGPVN